MDTIVIERALGLPPRIDRDTHQFAIKMHDFGARRPGAEFVEVYRDGKIVDRINLAEVRARATKE